MSSAAPLDHKRVPTPSLVDSTNEMVFVLWHDCIVEQLIKGNRALLSRIQLRVGDRAHPTWKMELKEEVEAAGWVVEEKNVSTWDVSIRPEHPVVSSSGGGPPVPAGGKKRKAPAAIVRYPGGNVAPPSSSSSPRPPAAKKSCTSLDIAVYDAQHKLSDRIQAPLLPDESSKKLTIGSIHYLFDGKSLTPLSKAKYAIPVGMAVGIASFGVNDAGDICPALGLGRSTDWATCNGIVFVQQQVKDTIFANIDYWAHRPNEYVLVESGGLRPYTPL